MIPLFAYGTLRSAAVRAALFERPYPVRAATLRDWRVVVAETGYFTVVAEPGASLAGDLIELDDAGLARADAWEEAAYERITVRAEDAGRRVEAWLYVRPTASRTPPPPGAFALHDEAAVLDAIRALRSSGTG